MRKMLVVAFAALMPMFAGAQAAKVEEGYTSLFNGKDLSGWVYGKSGKGENKSGAGYAIENGVLFCTVKDGGNLFTEKEYGDFSFKFEFKLTVNANNGIGIRAPLEGDSAYAGMEIQVLDDGGPAYKSLRPEQYHGSVYDLVACKRGSQKPVGEWNEQEIWAKGSKVKVTLNGTVIVDADLADIKDEAKLKKHPGVKNAKGHIGFLGHGARVEFRGMRVKEL
ncbi:MAG TPA: DUF1080 domain-containing protein [Planctomycetota bacterium]|nr:DUF1080 domain-containing protein [Planctomycetota bacterium]